VRIFKELGLAISKGTEPIEDRGVENPLG